jgi:serine/threonine-protein kinase
MTAPQRFGRFEVLSQLGQGGQGAVLRARDPASGQDVALKLLLRVDAKNERRFRQEAQVLAGLEHPGIVRVVDSGVEGGVPWLAMALVEGESLKARVEHGGPLAPAEAARIVVDLARAVAHCHERGIVHRDLKPENVLLERASGRPVLVDFGLLRRDAEVFGALSIDARSRLSKTGELRGTPAYMAPEQVNPGKFGQVGPATDVYALGGVLCFLLTGEPAYAADSLPGLMVKILEGERVDVRERRPDVPKELADVCARALARLPDGRRVVSAGADGDVIVWDLRAE